MKIAPSILRRHLEQAAIEQLTSSLLSEGYEVEREVPAVSAGGRRGEFDVLARRDGEKIVYEVKVLGEGPVPASKQLGTLAALAREQGARFRLVVVRPGREVEVEVAGIEEALRSALEEDPTGELGTLGERVSVDGVDGVEIERLQVTPGGAARVAGKAIASISQYAGGGDLKFASTDIPFGFDVALDPDGRIGDDPPPSFDLDLSTWHGDGLEDGA